MQTLYHGTTEAAAQAILRDGLLPKPELRWQASLPTRLGQVAIMLGLDPEKNG